MWDLPGPGLEPVSPALAGGFLTTAPPGKSQDCVFDSILLRHHFLFSVCQMKKLGQRIKTFSSGWANSWLLEGQLVSCAPQNPWGAESTAWQLAPSELLLNKYMLEAPEFCAFGNITPFLFSVFPSWWPNCSLLSSSIKFLYIFIPTQSLAVVENGVTSRTPGTPGSRRISGIHSRYQLPMSSGL